MTTTDNNKLIAKFLGYTQPHPDYPTTTYWYKKDTEPLTTLLFDKDWNWLMEVVEKCLIGEAETNRPDLINNIYEGLNNVNKQAVYNACIEFIKS